MIDSKNSYLDDPYFGSSPFPSSSALWFSTASLTNNAQNTTTTNTSDATSTTSSTKSEVVSLDPPAFHNEIWRALYRRVYREQYPNLPALRLSQCRSLQQPMPPHPAPPSYGSLSNPISVSEPKKEEMEKVYADMREWEAEEETRISAMFPQRNWFQFYVDAAVITRRNAKVETIFSSYYDSNRYSRPESKPSHLPESLQRLTDYPLYSRYEQRFLWRPRPFIPPPIPLFVDPLPAPVNNAIRPPLVVGRGGPMVPNVPPTPFGPNLAPMNPYPMKCAPPPMPIDFYNDANVLACEVGDFFDFPYDADFFAKSENKVKYI
jgi:hypothetical protein